jgi:hypothetical protein
MAYSYKKSRALSKIRSTCRLLGLDYYYVKDKALIRGQLQTLFGNPLYTSPDVENQYGYVVIMENDQGAQYFLHVYSAKFGPSIGGNKKFDGIENAALELKQYISKAAPSDYEYEGIYKDILRIKMGVKNGEPYYFAININTGQDEEAKRIDEEQKLVKLLEEVGWIAKWEARGEEQKALAIAQNLVNLGIPAETVISATGLDPEKAKNMYQTNSK